MGEFARRAAMCGALGMLAVGLAMLLAVVPLKAQQTASSNVYVITHVDLGATGDPLAAATKDLREFAADSRKDPGCVRFELLIQDGRLNHFTIVSVWRNREAFEAHSAAAHTKRFRDKVQPAMGSPFDERLHSLVP